jgi:hypothetical protein
MTTMCEFMRTCCCHENKVKNKEEVTKNYYEEKIRKI